MFTLTQDEIIHLADFMVGYYSITNISPIDFIGDLDRFEFYDDLNEDMFTNIDEVWLHVGECDSCGIYGFPEEFTDGYCEDCYEELEAEDEI